MDDYVGGKPAAVATQHHDAIDARCEKGGCSLCLEIIDDGAIGCDAAGRLEAVDARGYLEDVEGQRGGDDVD